MRSAVGSVRPRRRDRARPDPRCRTGATPLPESPQSGSGSWRCPLTCAVGSPPVPRAARLPLFRKAHERDRPRPLDGDRQLTLMPQAIARHPARNDPAPFGQEVPEQTDILIINGDLVMAEPAHPPALKTSSFHDPLPFSSLDRLVRLGWRRPPCARCPHARPAAPIPPPRGASDALRHHLVPRHLLPVLRLELAHLQPTF